MGARRLRVLYFCEGFTDIRFVSGLAARCELTFATPSREFVSSGLADRLAAAGVVARVDQIEGGRVRFQAASLAYLFKVMQRFDVVLAQGMGRGAVNATIVGRLLGTPVVTYESIAAVPYWRCRRERGSIGPLVAGAGEVFIRACQHVSGRLAHTTIALGDYLQSLVSHCSRRTAPGYYYGVDTDLYKPVSADQRAAFRARQGIGDGTYLILYASRVSHEKDPETVLRAVDRVRRRGLDAVVMNLGGGHAEFCALATSLGLNGTSAWVMGRPAAHPMRDLCEYFQAADLVVQCSLEEGLGMSPLEALACGTPVVATNVGGLSQLREYAQLVDRRDVEGLARAIEWAAAHRDAAMTQALKGRGFVETVWRSDRAFDALVRVLEGASGRPA